MRRTGRSLPGASFWPAPDCCVFLDHLCRFARPEEDFCSAPPRVGALNANALSKDPYPDFAQLRGFARARNAPANPPRPFFFDHNTPLKLESQIRLSRPDSAGVLGEKKQKKKVEWAARFRASRNEVPGAFARRFSPPPFRRSAGMAQSLTGNPHDVSSDDSPPKPTPLRELVFERTLTGSGPQKFHARNAVGKLRAYGEAEGLFNISQSAGLFAAMAAMVTDARQTEKRAANEKVRYFRARHNPDL